MLDAVILNPNKEPQVSVIWLHGLGADGNDFAPAVPLLNVSPTCQIRYVFPHAPIRSVSVNMGMQMRAWYDIFDPVIGAGKEDETGIRQSATQIVELIENEQQLGIPAERIVLAGFSQGGAIALFSAIRHSVPLAGIVALSTYLPLADKTLIERSPANQNIPILFLHGTFDPMISIALAEASRNMLEQNGYNVDSQDFPIPHSVSPEELAVIGKWLTARIKPN